MGWLSNWQLDPIPREELAGAAPRAAIVARPGSGRTVWLAVDPSGVAPGYRDGEIMRAVLANAVHWTGRQPLVAVSTCY